jgi:hypothetical protein
MIEKFTDAFGNVVECDDTVTALGPHPPLAGTSAESGFNPHYQQIRDPYGDRQRARENRKTSGYKNPVDDPEYREKHWPTRKTI